MRRALGVIGTAWALWMSTHQVVLGMGVDALPGKWRHECHMRLGCHPESRARVTP